MPENKQKKYTLDELNKLGLQALKEYAQTQGIDVYGKTRKQILGELGVSGDARVIVIPPDVDPERRRELEQKNWMVPQPIRVPVELLDYVLKVRETEPFAFNGYDFTDKKQEVIHVFDRDVECTCGAKFRIPEKTPDLKNPCTMMMCPGIKETKIMFGKPIDTRTCISPGRFRKYIYHKVDLRGNGE